MQNTTSTDLVPCVEHDVLQCMYTRCRAAQLDANDFRPGVQGAAMKRAAEGLGLFPKDDYRSWPELAELLVAHGIGAGDLR